MKDMEGIQAKITGKKKIAQDTYEVTLKTENPFNFKPGQYIHLTLPYVKYPDPRGKSRDFGIIPKSARQFAVAFRNTGSGFKKTLFLLTEKEEVFIQGPYGVFTVPENLKKPLIFIVGGIGIAPCISILKLLFQKKISLPITLILINLNSERATYAKTLRQYQNSYPNFTFKNHTAGFSDNLILDEKTNLRKSDIYVAGPSLFVDQMLNLLNQLSIRSNNIRSIHFPGYSISNSEFKSLNQDILKGKLKKNIEKELSERSITDLGGLLEALSTTALVSETDADGNITFANDKFVEISKYPRGELIGQNHRILKSSFHPQTFYENLWKTITAGKIWRGEIKNKAKDGTYYWVDTSIAPIVGANGKPVKYISVRFPITEKKIAEERLENKVRQHFVVNLLSQEALVVKNIVSLFERASHLLSETLHVDYCFIFKTHSGGNLSLKGQYGLKDENKKNEITQEFSKQFLPQFILHSKQPVYYYPDRENNKITNIFRELSIINGVSFAIQGSYDIFGFLSVFTTKKRIFTSDDLNFLQSVSNILAHAERNQIERRKDEFLSIASHELKTPLTSIKTFTQILQRVSNKSQNKKCAILLVKIDQQINKLTNLIGDLLDITKINTGKLDYNDEVFNLNEIIDETLEEIKLVAKDWKIIKKKKGMAYINGDKYRLTQVLTNIINNALKFSFDHKEIILNVEKNTNSVTVSIKDFGIGIAKKDQDRIFERFFRSSGKKRRNFPGGLGLGLYISSEIIKRHRGSIWVESQKNKGSTFYFSLPLVNNKKSVN